MENIKTYLREGFNVTSAVAGIFGAWVVSSEGDIINTVRHYPIYSYQVEDDGWLLHLRDKTWFDESAELHFLEAFDKACLILGIKVNLKRNPVRRIT